MLSASSLEKCIRSATRKAQAIMTGARLMMADLVAKIYVPECIKLVALSCVIGPYLFVEHFIKFQFSNLDNFVCRSIWQEFIGFFNLTFSLTFGWRRLRTVSFSELGGIICRRTSISTAVGCAEEVEGVGLETLPEGSVERDASAFFRRSL